MEEVEMVSLNQEDKRIHDLAYLYLPHEQASPEEVKLLRAAYRAGYREALEEREPDFKEIIAYYEDRAARQAEKQMWKTMAAVAVAAFFAGLLLLNH